MGPQLISCGTCAFFRAIGLRKHGASMGPQLISCGTYDAAVAAARIRKSFNGAAADQLRNVLVVIATAHRATGFNGAAADQLRNDDGKRVGADGKARLQWGRS